MKILALDLGTKTGWAVNSLKGPLVGTATLATTAELRADKASRGNRRIDCRIINFHRWLNLIVRIEHPEVIVFEDVLFSVSLAQAQLWSSLRGVLWSICAEFPDIKIDCLNTTSLKKFATGCGGADKQAMAAALPKEVVCQCWGDDEVDAYHLLRWAQSVYEKS